MPESIISESVLIREFFAMDRFLYNKKRRIPHFKFLDKTGVHRCCRQFCLSYSTVPRYFLLEAIIFKSVLIGNFFVMD